MLSVIFYATTLMADMYNSGISFMHRKYEYFSDVNIYKGLTEIFSSS